MIQSAAAAALARIPPGSAMPPEPALARHKIRVNSVLPGWTITEMASRADRNDVFRNPTTKRTPVRRWADPSEFREVGAFLADASKTFRTGQELGVEAGYSVY